MRTSNSSTSKLGVLRFTSTVPTPKIYMYLLKKTKRMTGAISLRHFPTWTVFHRKINVPYHNYDDCDDDDVVDDSLNEVCRDCGGLQNDQSGSRGQFYFVAPAGLLEYRKSPLQEYPLGWPPGWLPGRPSLLHSLGISWSVRFENFLC